MKRTQTSSLREDTHRTDREQTTSVTAFPQRQPSSPSLASSNNLTIASKPRSRPCSRSRSDPPDIYSPVIFATGLQHSILSFYFEGLMTNNSHSQMNSDPSSTTVSLLEDDPKSVRSSEKAMLLVAAEAKGVDVEGNAKNRADADRRVVENCEKAMGKREEVAGRRRQHQADEEAARQAKADKQATKQAEGAAKKQKRAEDKKKKAEKKVEKNAAKAREKERKRYGGGMSWGYDPNAGVSPWLAPEIQVSRYQPRSSDGESRKRLGTASSACASGPRYYDRVTGTYYPKHEFDTALGFEVGGPNRTKPPSPLRDIFPKVKAGEDIEANEMSRIDHRGFSREPGPKQAAFSDDNVEGKGKSRAEGYESVE